MTFYYEAIFLPEGVKPPPRSLIPSPKLQVYVNCFGEFKDDKGLVAEIDGKIVGAVGVRIMNDYGHIDDKTPFLSKDGSRLFQSLDRNVNYP